MRKTLPVLGGAAVLAVTITLAPPMPSPAVAADVTQTATCTDDGGHLWTVRSIWGSTYTGSDGRRHITNDTTGFTSAAADATTVDYSIRSYNADGSQAGVQGEQDRTFNFADGTSYLNRNPANPIIGGAPPRITVNVGDGNDGKANCTVTFTQPQATEPGVVTPPPTASPTPSDPLTPLPATEAAIEYGWGTPEAADEFNYTGAPDSTKWSVYNSAGHAGNGLRRPSAWKVDGAAATVTGDSQGTTGGMSFRPDRGTTYGRWEARMKVSANRDPQYHPVLIVWPDAGRTASTNYQEIDFSESTGDPAVNRFFLHYGSGSKQVSASKTLDMTAWHNYAVDWQPGKITGYIDGIKWFENTAQAPLIKAPSHFTAQLDWFPSGSAPRTSSMSVDWVRVYQP